MSLAGGGEAPLVWRHLTQQALDDAYDQSIYAPNRAQILARYSANSESTVKRLGAPRQFRYGSADKESLLVFSPPNPNGRVNIFVHGGAWRSGTAAQYAFLADMFIDAGVHLVLPDFDWVQDCDGNLMTVADQVQRAIAWVCSNADEFGGDAQQVFLSAHSSGAHLAGAALPKMPAHVVQGALLCSGMYDLEPVSLSARSSYVNFDTDSLEQLSAMRSLAQITTPLIIAYGDHETPEFQRQSQEFFDAMLASGANVELIVARGYNHFEILETLANPLGLLGRAVLGQMLGR